MMFLVENILFINMGRKRIYTLNENYFDKINTKEKAYIIGFIYADGSIVKNYLSITLNKKDVDVLKFIKKELSYSGPIYKKNYVRLTISSRKIVSNLNSIGIIQNKTYSSKNLPLIPSKYFNDFLLGFFDGDGSIYKSSKKYIYDYTINFTNNLQSLKEIKFNLKNLNISSSKIRKRYDNEISCMLDIRGSLNLEKIYKIFYENPPKFYLERKKIIFDKFKSSLGVMSKRNFDINTINKIKKMYNLKYSQKKISNTLNLKYSSVRCVIQRLRKNGEII